MRTLKVSQGGRVVIPAELREKLNIHQGDELILEERDGELVLASKRLRLRKVQQACRTLFALEAGRGIAEELIAERREEAAKEEAETQEFWDALNQRRT